jgi:hypothetical protein
VRVDNTLIADSDGVYHPGDFNDRLVLGLKGTMSEALCQRRHKASYADLFVMPTWQEVRQVGAVSCLERSA